ncbi:hypothetical protein [Streptomyces sp. NPDC050355]|uniref:hypothetical protein n=1 Tax=Streptomyces sp. NPDC050355 TaxID=3365609 RepID=UPI0037A7DDF8
MNRVTPNQIMQAAEVQIRRISPNLGISYKIKYGSWGFYWHGNSHDADSRVREIARTAAQQANQRCECCGDIFGRLYIVDDEESCEPWVYRLCPDCAAEREPANPDDPDVQYIVDCVDEEVVWQWAAQRLRQSN